MAEEADDVHWKMDAVMLFMKSPEYTVPVMDFIDENCMVFDADEESKLEFSEVHGKFVETVFGLLEKFLAEIGVSQEEFSSVCQQQVMSGGKNAFVFQQIMAADDFQAFKKMMVQRNRQLSYENLKHLQRLQLAAGMSDGGQGAGAVAADAVGVVEEEGGEEDDEEHQMHEALRLSRMTFVDDDPELAEALRISAQESVTPDVPSSTSQAVGGEVAALTEAQAAGMSEDQLLQAAIQESIKASVTVPPPPPPPAEAETVDDAPLVYDDQAAQTAAIAAAPATPPTPATPATPPTPSSITKPSEEDIVHDPAELDKVRGMALVTDAELIAAKQHHERAVVEHALAVNEALARAQEPHVPETEPTASAPPPPAPTPAPAAAAEAACSAVAGGDGVAEAASPVHPPPTRAPEPDATASQTPPAPASLPAIRGQFGASSLGALPPITGSKGADLSLSSQTAAQMHKSAKAQEKEARRAAEQALLMKMASQQPPPAPEGLKLSEEEIAQRKTHLEDQRARLLQSKKKEREDQMKEYQSHKEAAGGGAAGTLGRRVSEKQQQVAQDVLAAVKGVHLIDPSAAHDSMTEHEVKRLEMRKALAKRMKEDLSS